MIDYNILVLVNVYQKVIEDHMDDLYEKAEQYKKESLLLGLTYFTDLCSRKDLAEIVVKDNYVHFKSYRDQDHDRQVFSVPLKWFKTE